MCRHLPGRKSGAKHPTSVNCLIFRDIRERHTQETNGMQHAFVFVCGHGSSHGRFNSRVEMRRVVAYLVLLGFFTGASVATARNAIAEHHHVRSVTSRRRSLKIQPNPKRGKSRRMLWKRRCKSCGVWSNLKLRASRFTKAFGSRRSGGAASKETVAPTSAFPAGVIQPSSSAAITAVQCRECAKQGAASTRTKTSHRCRSELARRILLRAFS